MCVSSQVKKISRLSLHGLNFLPVSELVRVRKHVVSNLRYKVSYPSPLSLVGSHHVTSHQRMLSQMKNIRRKKDRRNLRNKVSNLSPPVPCWKPHHVTSHQCMLPQMKNLVMKNNHRNQKQVQLHNEQLHAHKLEKLSSNRRHNHRASKPGAQPR